MYMKMTLTIILLNMYYIGTAIGYIIKEILWLRVVIIFAGLCMITRGIIIDNYIIVFWISLFVVINIIQVIRILLEKRPVPISEDIRDLYENLFDKMSTREFILFWKMGDKRTLGPNKYLCHDNVPIDEIVLVIDGYVEVVKNDKHIATLGRGYFIAEMQYLLGVNPSADVMTRSEVKLVAWNHKKLQRLKETYPIIYNKFQLILSKDLTNKLQRYL